MGETLGDVLAAAAGGRFPPTDGGTTIVAQPGPRDAGVLAFTAHSVIFLDEAEDWIRATLAGTDADPFGASMNPGFLAALMARTGRSMNCVDLLTCAPALPGEPPLVLTEIQDQEHPRVVRALTFRDDVRVWAADGGVLILGRGVAGRWEVAIELDAAARGRGLGAQLALSARHLVPDGVLWAQQSPGNARSVRTFQAAGFRPVGSEALLIAPR
ncbi:GNAT family N-acetyltransferase [Streptomyces sp. NPDC048361]|uniref:GNAT family N-acetyltransferase n=1 Tax=Streptomyces sp. NPDC048361 TaxID=3154720 RepID=UPI00341C53D3